MPSVIETMFTSAFDEQEIDERFVTPPRGTEHTTQHTPYAPTKFDSTRSIPLGVSNRGDFPPSSYVTPEKEKSTPVCPHAPRTEKGRDENAEEQVEGFYYSSKGHPHTSVSKCT
jgi:hypothetical protein